jgi:GT2 family glycosyltransferase
MLSILKMPRDKARNFLVQEALDFNSDYIVFLDDDNIVPFDFIQQLLDTNEPIIGLNYSLKKPYYESAHLMSNGKQYPIPTDSKGLVSVNRCFALGASLIKREVFEKIGFPWFQEWTDDNKLESHQTFEDGTKISYTDDAFFTKRAIDAGYTPKVLSNIHSAHIDFQTFRVYGHPDIIDQKTAILKNIVSIKWALSEENNRELIV